MLKYYRQDCNHCVVLIINTDLHHFLLNGILAMEGKDKLTPSAIPCLAACGVKVPVGRAASSQNSPCR